MAFSAIISNLEDGQENIVIPIATREVFFDYWQKAIDEKQLELWSLVRYEMACVVTKDNLNVALTELAQIQKSFEVNSEMREVVRESLLDRVRMISIKLPQIWDAYPNAEVTIG